ncbi:MAG: hypothetical protein ABW252_09470 [Polyangiales bacterium]
MQRPDTCTTQVILGCARGWLWATSALLLASCIVDDENKCGANQVESDVKHVSGCICAPNAIPNADGIGCTACGANASVQNGACTCNTGFAQVTAGGACVASQLAAPCSATAPCAGEYPFCTPTGYCSTSGCTSSAQCPGGYTCDTSGATSFCRKPATGQGAACTAAGNECAANDAKFCALQGPAGTCAVSGCKTTKGRCDVGFACCDFGAFGLTDFCLSEAALSGGKCPGTMADPVVVP